MWPKVIARILILLLVLSLVPVAAFANPLGGTVGSGSASIVTNGNTLTIDQSSQRAVINWNSFNIAPNETTKFTQPNSGAVTLNRVNSANPSTILGNLDANGNVILVNPSGVFFGKGSQVDVNGLVATTANVTDKNFMSGNMNFNIPGNPNATVSNAGTITAGQAGLVGLVAPNVENSGVINAKLGKVQLGSGDTFTLDTYGDGLINIGVSDQVQKQLVENSGTINAAGGTIQLTAAAGRKVVDSLISVTGELNAPTAQKKNGNIIISAAGANGTTKTGASAVNVSGKMNASGYGAGQTGGTISVTGDNVKLSATAVIDASGAAGGGTVNIGGNIHGQGILAHAVTTTVTSGAQIKANAVTTGNGGQVAVWSDSQTAFNGTIQSKGGAISGNGGLVETSSHGVLSVGGMVDASATHGAGGEWLLDPASLTISDGTDTNVVNCPTCAPDGTIAVSNLTPLTIETALNAGTNVTVTTGGDSFAGTGDITVNSAIITTGAGSLTLSSYRNIILNAGITLVGGALTLQADNQGNGSGYINVSGAISTAGGNITMGGGNGVISAGNGFATGNAGQSTGILINDVAVNAGGGNVIANGVGFNGATNGNTGIEVTGAGASLQTSGSGIIALAGNGAGNTSSSYDYGVEIDTGGVISSVNGNVTAAGTVNNTGSGFDNYGLYLEGLGSTIRTSGSGDISVAGTGGDANPGPTVGNYGVIIYNAGIGIGSGGIIATGSGNIAVTGTGSIGGSANGEGSDGIYVNNGAIAAKGGTVNITGIGGMNGNGVNLFYDGIISDTIGDINVTGMGGSSGGGYNLGVSILSGSSIRTGAGNISIAGVGGAGSGRNDHGVQISSLNGVQTTGAGNILITGIGGASSGGNDGVLVEGGSNVTAAGSGAITLVGTGGGGSTETTDNDGVQVYGTIAASGGAISVTGKAGSSYANGDKGVDISGSVTNTGFGTINLEGTAGGAGISAVNYGVYNEGTISAVNGDVTLTAQGGNNGGGSQNPGLNVGFINQGVLETTGSGNISIVATGGGGGGTGSFNYGVYDFGSIKAGAGNGSISITGTGGNAGGSGSNNYGVYIAGGILYTSGNVQTGAGSSGNISITGTGGNATGSGANNYGVYIGSANAIQEGAGATGAISITGTGGNSSGNNNYGVYIAGFQSGNSILTSVSGNGNALTITGTGGGTGAAGGDDGIVIYEADVTNSGAGTITLNGTGGAGGGGSEIGVAVENGNVEAANGNLTVRAAGGGSGDGGDNFGLFVEGVSSTIQTSGSGNIQVAGTGGNANAGNSFQNYGVLLTGAGEGETGFLASGSGNITILGTGSNGSSADSDGIWASAASIAGAGGAISVTGIGGSGGDGVNLIAEDIISNAGGNIGVTGVGGAAGLGGGSNLGVNVGSSSAITTSGAGNITVAGTGGGAGGSGGNKYGVSILDTNGVETTGSGNILVTGIGGASLGDGNYGIFNNGGSVLADYQGVPGVIYAGGINAAGTGSVTVNGTGGGSGASGGNEGVYSDYITANGGAISVNGQGGNASGNGNSGIEIAGLGIKNIGSGTITLDGTGGGTGNSGSNYGVEIGPATYAPTATISTVNGDISVTGFGGNEAGTGASNDGVYIGSNSTIQATGTGNIAVTGTGGASSSGSNAGVYINSTSGTTNISTTNGNVAITGTGDNSVNTAGAGIYVTNGDISAGGAGNVTLTSTGSTSAPGGFGIMLNSGQVSTDNGGMLLFTAQGGTVGGDIVDDSVLSVTGTGSITISSYRDININEPVTLQGGDLLLRADNTGLGAGYINIGAVVSTNGGDITMGGGSGRISAGSGFAYGDEGISVEASQGVGILVRNGIDAGGGNIIINGQGVSLGNIDGDYSGVELVNNGPVTTRGAGSITLTGAGGAGTTIDSLDYGVYIRASNAIEASGTGAISISGDGGSGFAGFNSGVYIQNAMGGSVVANGNPINITGIGGGASSSVPGLTTSSINGVEIDGTVQSTSGTISITGMGGQGPCCGENAEGVYIYGGAINNANGNVLITGYGGNAPFGLSSGIFMFAPGSITAGGAGAITLNGIAMPQENAGYGLEILGGLISSVNGNLTINAQGSTGGGLFLSGNSTVETTGLGNISITGTGGGLIGQNNGIFVNTGSIVRVTGSGSISLDAPSSTTSVGNCGVDIEGSVDNESDNGNITIIGYGGQGVYNNPGVTINGTVHSINGNVLVEGSSNVGNAGGGTVNSGVSVGATGSVNSSGGGNITIVADTDSFSAASNLSTASGRWLVYSADPASNNDGVLAPSFTRYSCTYGGSCPSFPATGNGLLYSFTPELTATSRAMAVSYGSALPSYAYAISGYRGGDAATDAVTGSLNGSTVYTNASSVGVYNINYSGGSLVSAMGYGFAYANNMAVLTVNPAALTITANSFGKAYGSTYAFSGAEFTASGLANSDSVNHVNLASAGAASVASVNGGLPYTISVSGASGTGLSNYTITYVNGGLTVTPAALSVTANSFGKVYGSAYNFAGTEFATSGLVNGDTVTKATLTSAGAASTSAVNGGVPYAITASGAVGTGLSNYSISYVSGGLTVIPAALTITAKNASKAYGTTPVLAGSQFTATGLLNDNTVTSVSLASAGTAATATVAGGPYAIAPGAAVGTGLSNYSITYVNGALTVTPVALTITANNISKTYGTTYGFAGTEFTAKGLLNGDTVAGVNLASGGAVAGATVAGGAYTITAGGASGAAASNYNISYVSGKMTVTPAALTITANSFNKVYGATYAFSGAGTEFTTAGLANGDIVTKATLASTGSRLGATVNSGPYAVTIAGATGTGLANYAITYVSGAMTITPAALTITASNASKVYGATSTLGSTAFTTTGLVTGDTVSKVTLASAGTAASATVNGGTPYAIVASGAVSPELADYTITYVSGGLTVTPAALTVTAANLSKSYGTAYNFAGTEFTTKGLVNGDAVTGAVLASAGAATTAAVNGGKAYAVTAAGATGTGLSNYTISYVSGAMTVTPAALTVTADNFSKIYGTTYAFAHNAFTTSGLVNGDTVTGATFASTGAAVTATVNGGVAYAVSASAAVGTGLANYKISYVNGGLVVTPAALIVTAENLNKVYGTAYAFTGKEIAVTGLVNGNTVTSATLTSLGAAAGATVAGGPYTISVSGAAGTGLSNYTISYASGAMTITPAALTVTAKSLSKVYGTTYNFAGTEFTTKGLVNGDTVTGASFASTGAAATATVNAGAAYAVTASGATGTGLSNYTISYVNGGLTVTPAALTVTAKSFSKVYGVAYTFAGTEITETGLVNGDTVTSAALSSTGSRLGATVNAGVPYAITVSRAVGTGLSNYAISYVNGGMTITPAALTITANNINKVYGSAYVFSGNEYTETGLVTGDSLGKVTLTSQGAAAGAAVNGGAPYAINVSGATSPELSDYTATYVSGNMTVAP